MTKLLLFIKTIRYLKIKQIFHRVLKILTQPSVTDKSFLYTPYRSRKWLQIKLYDEKINDNFEAVFLNYKKKIELPLDWNNPSLSKLWVYNLHYFEDLLSYSSNKKNKIHKSLINQWIDDNPVGYGNGWEPYPSSLRITNIIKAWLNGLELDEKIFKSIFEQTSYLSNNLEKHLLANHYFVNLKAILFAGIIFNKRSWIELAQNSLDSEISEQILGDGSHCELSPMYHSLILVDMLDILNICNAYPSVISSNFISLLNKNIPKMITFMQSMAHPDGGVSFFNDSVDGIAPQKHKIEYYAEQLSFKSCFPNITNPTITNNLDSGYICVSAYNSKLIFDASPIGYSYNPGHAHADTLSFELSIGQERVFVNSGISEYEFGKNRIIQRKTRSHNTIEVNDKDSSEVWSAFRVASRANVFNRSITENHSGVQLCASHDGYKSLMRGCYVTRKIDFGENYLNISDLIDGKYEKAVSRLHFHPSLLVTLNRNILNASSEHFRLTCNLKNKSFVLSDYEYHPEFGVTLNSKVLELDVLSGYQELEFSWIFK